MDADDRAAKVMREADIQHAPLENRIAEEILEAEDAAEAAMKARCRRVVERTEGDERLSVRAVLDSILAEIDCL